MVLIASRPTDPLAKPPPQAPGSGEAVMIPGLVIRGAKESRKLDIAGAAESLLDRGRAAVGAAFPWR